MFQDNHSHHSSAKHGHNDHEEPARNQVEAPEDVANNGRESVLSEPTVERVEDAVVQLALALVAVLLQLDEVVAGDGGQVESLGVEIDRGRRGKHLEDPKSASRGGPGVAKDGLVLAVEHCGVRGARSHGELGCGLVESGLDLVAMALI